MSITFDSSSKATYGGTPNSWSHTCAGGHRILIITTITDNDSVSSVTYNSITATLIGKGTFNSGVRKTASLYYLLAPSVGTHNITITTTGESCGGGAISLAGVKSSGQPDSSATFVDDTPQSSASEATTVIANNSWLVAAFCDDQGSGETAGAGTTIRQTSGQGMVLYDSNGAVGTGSQSLVINFSPDAKFSGVITSIAPNTLPTTLTADITLIGYLIDA